jgi:ADP-heptose:LPS heptosyltransferase
VVVTGTEQDLAAEVARRSGARVLATTLAELAGVVAHARLVVSGDTGIAHLATAYGTPSVVLFGPVPPSRWGPPAGRAYHRPIWHGTHAERGDSPGPDVHPALLAIGVQEVLRQAEEAGRHAAAAK